MAYMPHTGKEGFVSPHRACPENRASGRPITIPARQQAGWIPAMDSGALWVAPDKQTANPRP